ncbi:hypothetical protein EVAR_46572_1 [Eumeta japonica]|uniref:Uncharacterized protein n=1 Tax=Eumeta variegata TaxID=151549 RepID=A0A4C1WT98_EUMVA|nr:hypothetical protein EVAR_46572_1 [Eumeta japonica]
MVFKSSVGCSAALAAAGAGRAGRARIWPFQVGDASESNTTKPVRYKRSPKFVDITVYPFKTDNRAPLGTVVGVTWIKPNWKFMSATGRRTGQIDDRFRLSCEYAMEDFARAKF